MTDRALNPDGTVRDTPIDLDHPSTPTDRAQAITDCRLCDDDGYRGLVLCDHIDRTATTQRGLPLCRAALTRKHATTDTKPTETRPQTPPE